MATTTAGARASRRAAARQAAAHPAPPAVETPEALVDVMGDEDDEAFGPEDVTPAPSKIVAGASESAANSAPASEHLNADSAPVRPTSVQQRPAAGPIALPMEDLTRQIDASDIIIPKLRLVQAMSKTNTVFAASRGTDGVGMGNWTISSQNKNLGDVVYFVPIDMRKSRAYFVQGQGLMCRSFDLLNGEGDPGGSCQGSMDERLTLPAVNRGCPLRHWNDKTPPKCGVTYNFPGYAIADIEAPDKVVQCILQLRSAATQAAKAINTFVMNEGGGVWQAVVLELGIETKTNTRGTFFVPTVDFYDSTDAPEFARLRRRADAMARQLGAVTLRSSIEDDAE